MTETPTQEAQQQQQETPSPFGGGAWTEQVPEQKQESQQQQQPAVQSNEQPIVQQPPKEEEEILDPKDWLKREFEIDDVQVLKQEREELKKLRETAQTPAEIKFANEQSEKFFSYLKEGKEDEVYSFLDTKKKLSTADKLSAADALKLHISQTNKHYSSADVQDVFEERYSIPSKPVQAADELDADYQNRLNEWQSVSEKITRKIERDAFAAKQELTKMNAELVLPDINKPQQPSQNQPDQKELEKLRDGYLKRLESDYKNFNGYELKYKDEEVEIPVSFGVSDEEKVALKKELENFDVEGVVYSRWFDKQGQPNIPQIMDDLTLLRNKEKIFQKVANEVGSKMREHYIKVRSNITVNPDGNQNTFQPQRQNGQSISPFAMGAWSEKPPTITNN